MGSIPNDSTFFKKIHPVGIEPTSPESITGVAFPFTIKLRTLIYFKFPGEVGSIPNDSTFFYKKTTVVGFEHVLHVG